MKKLQQKHWRMIEMKTTTTKALKNELKYSPELNLDNSVKFSFFHEKFWQMYGVMTEVSLLHYQTTTNSEVNGNLACILIIEITPLIIYELIKLYIISHDQWVINMI